MRRHLFLQIYVAFLCVAVLCAAVAALAMRVSSDFEPNAYKSAVADLLADALPRVPGAELDAALRRLSDRLGLDIAVVGADGRVQSSTSPGLSSRVRNLPREGDWHDRGVHAMRLSLPDGRLVAAASRRDHARDSLGFFGTLAAVLFAAALGCYPIARRITRRLERLQRSVERFAEGDLGTRVAVRGRDEVARLAVSFNRALSRIEQLVTAQRRVLASASHELRSPMTRLRMAIELLAEGQPTDVTQREQLLRNCAKDIEELDALVEDVLLSARLEGRAPTSAPVRLDITSLVRTAAARVNATVIGEPVALLGDERLLLRLLRNLFDNAERYGNHTPIEASVTVVGTQVVVTVCDRGPGVAASERERIFEPFYRPQGHREGADGGVGLGLSLVRQIATHHSGTVRYLDRDGGGSCFEVRLPHDAKATALGSGA